jgi:hypothetical protein
MKNIPTDDIEEANTASQMLDTVIKRLRKLNVQDKIICQFLLIFACLITHKNKIPKDWILEEINAHFDNIINNKEVK